MSLSRSRISIGLILAAALFGTAGWSLRAQVPARSKTPGNRSSAAALDPGRGPAEGGRTSVQEAMLRPFPIPFRDETSLGAVVDHLASALDAPVVLDRGALDRLGLTEDDTVRLALDGVRLKTGLQVLLDQVGLTYRVVPEDNLLILTDAAESDDRHAAILDELRSLHRDVHDLQDAVDELLGPEGDWGDDGAFLGVATRPASGLKVE